MRMVVRKASGGDMPAIERLIRMYPRQLMQNHLPRAGSFFVALADGLVVGCCALQVYSKRIAEIRSLAVDKNYQGRGIAQKLISRCLARAKRQQVYEILAITGAARLFGKFGFGTFEKERFAMLKVLK